MPERNTDYYKSVAEPSRNLLQLTFNELLSTSHGEDDVFIVDRRVDMYVNRVLDCLSLHSSSDDEEERTLFAEKVKILLPAASCVIRASSLLSAHNPDKEAWRQFYLDTQDMWREQVISEDEVTDTAIVEISKDIVQYSPAMEGMPFRDFQEETRCIVRFSGIIDSCIVLAHMDYSDPQKVARV